MSQHHRSSRTVSLSHAAEYELERDATLFFAGQLCLVMAAMGFLYVASTFLT